MAQHCCKGDQPFQWENQTFDPQYIPNLLIFLNQNFHRWLRLTYLLICKIWWKSVLTAHISCINLCAMQMTVFCWLVNWKSLPCSFVKLFPESMLPEQLQDLTRKNPSSILPSSMSAVCCFFIIVPSFSALICWLITSTEVCVGLEQTDAFSRLCFSAWYDACSHAPTSADLKNTMNTLTRGLFSEKATCYAHINRNVYTILNLRANSPKKIRGKVFPKAKVKRGIKNSTFLMYLRYVASRSVLWRL